LCSVTCLRRKRELRDQVGLCIENLIASGMAPDGWEIQRTARFRRTIVVKASGEPERKGTRGSRSAASFQRYVLDQMEPFGQHAFTGPVAVDLDFISARANPPAIYSLAKHALDVLGAAVPENSL
jgi:hypothetical protein